MNEEPKKPKRAQYKKEEKSKMFWLERSKRMKSW